MSKQIEEDPVIAVQNLLKEINRVLDRMNAMTDRVNRRDDYFNTYKKVLNSGTKEGAAFKRSVKDLRMVASETIKQL